MIDIRQVDIRRAAQLDGERITGTLPLLHQCPQHQDDSASLAIYCDHIHCMGCGFRIQKRMDALAWLLGLSDWRAAMSVANSYLFTTTEEERKPKDRRKPTLTEVGIYERILEGECGDRREWLRWRGLSDATIRQAKIGHNGAAFVIPLFDQDYNLVTLRYRNDDEFGKYIEEFDENGDVIRQKKIPKYRGWPGHNEAMLYPMWKLADRFFGELTICEGEFDALLLWQNGIPAVTATNGASQQASVLSLIQKLPFRPTRLVICGDRDEPGIEAARKTFELAKETYERVEWLQWPVELGKDITEVLQKGYSYEYIRKTYGRAYECVNNPLPRDSEPTTKPRSQLLPPLRALRKAIYA